MAAKRKLEESEDQVFEGVSIMTAEMADELRAELLTKNKRLAKRQRLRTRPSVEISYTQQQFKESASFFVLPRELRNQVYQCLWHDTPLIRQQYLRKTYPVT